MAGLLDFLDTDEGRFGLSLLAAAGPTAQPMGFGQRLAGAVQMQDQFRQQQAEAEDRKRRAAMQEMQMTQLKTKAQEEARAREAAARKMELLPGLFTSTTQGEIGVPQSGGVPMFSQGAQVTRPSMQTRGFDVQRAIAAGYSPEEIKAYAELNNIGRQKVARTVEGVDAQGRPVTYQVDEYGQRVGDGIGQWKAPMAVNQGNRISMIDPASMQSRGTFDVSMSPAERDAAARGWAGNTLARQRLEFDMRGGAESGKPQYRDGQWVMAPANMQPGQSVPAIPTAGVKDANEALALISQAKKLIPSATGSYIGTAADAGARAFGISTKGDMATGQLQALEGALVSKMPKMSGPQSDKDVALYRQMAGVIGDPTIPTERKLAALATVEEIQRRYAGVSVAPMPAPGAMGSGSWNGGPVPKNPMKGQVIGGYKFQGGNPADPSNWEQAQ